MVQTDHLNPPYVPDHNKLFSIFIVFATNNLLVPTKQLARKRFSSISFHLLKAADTVHDWATSY
ncbi:hypothetical protein M5K25_001436 [Dendrobium thyrsiflorum]|uniref:Uncharacterized protein n=1 Tax=Dendrobium thyrsiflorum TaxID=117978 RepID=A0ABD0VRT2_DENTH